MTTKTRNGVDRGRLSIVAIDVSGLGGSAC